MDATQTILVTGASGFLAKHVIVQLLSKGFDVRGTLRTISKAESVRETIARHAGADALKRLDLVGCDLLSDQGWREAMQGVAGVIHTATLVVGVEPKDPAILIDPAVQGTARIMRFAHDAGATRVIMTSSIAAVGYGHDGPKGEIKLTADDWTDIEGLNGSWSYAEGKTAAERAAWQMAKRDGIDLTTICPSMILGPALDQNTSASLSLIADLLSGDVPAVPAIRMSAIDVRDVADMHVNALIDVETIGKRYLAAGPVIGLSQIAEILAANYPECKVSTRTVPKWLLLIIARFGRSVRQIAADIQTERHYDTQKGEGLLGRAFRSGEEATLSAAESILEYAPVAS